MILSEQELINDENKISQKKFIVKKVSNKKDLNKILSKENKNSIIKYIFFGIYLIIVCLIFLKLLIIPNLSLDREKDTNKKLYEYQNNNTHPKTEHEYDKINEFIIFCRKGTLINNIDINTLPNFIPKITVVIPVFNAAQTIKAAIRSIQNQQMKEIEILLVDDHSSDNSLEIINELQIEDPRIKLIKNKNSMGTLYTRSIGALKAKGKYIMPLDNDDLFINDIFFKCYEEAESNNIDIVEFLGFTITNSSLVNEKSEIPYFLKFSKGTQILRQPDLSTYMFFQYKNNFLEIDGYLWGKCIKSEIYRKALDLIGEDIYTKNVVWTEDRLVNFGLFRVANSFKKIDYFGIIYTDNFSSVRNNLIKKDKAKIVHDQLIYVANVFNLTKNSQDAKIAAFLFTKKLEIILNQLNKENKFIAKELYNKIMSCSNISEKRKNIILNIVQNKLE